MQRAIQLCSRRTTPLRFHINHYVCARGYARRHPAHRIPNKKADGNPFDSSNPAQSEAVEDGIETGAPQAPRRRFPRFLTPGKLLIYAILGYGGYRLYKWQTNPARSQILNPRNFSPFLLETREKVSPTSAVLNLMSYPAGQSSDFINAAWKTGCWSVEVIQPELQIKRNYTPLPPIDGSPNELTRLFVREEPNGEVSKFLHQINPGTIVHMRGPFLEYDIPDDIEEILFLAGGTGIATALQVAHCLFKARGLEKEKLPRMRILWANRRREDSRTGLESEEVQTFRRDLWARIRGAVTTGEGVSQEKVALKDVKGNGGEQTLLVDQVERFVEGSDGRISADYFVDEEGSFIMESRLRSLLEKSAARQQDTTENGNERKRLVLLSGPDGFIEYFAGPKKWSGGRQMSGPLGGLLMKINASGWDIWKL